MTADAPTILATSAGFEPGSYGPNDMRPGKIHYFAAELARNTASPRICFLTQAVGDQEGRIGNIYAAFARTKFVPSHLQLFPMPNVTDIRDHLLSQDVIWVGGGSVANMCAVWRVHGVDAILREAWESGVVLAGVSAGSICWHQGGTTDSYGLQLRGFTDGLGFLPYSNGVHYDSEEQRRPKFHELIANGTLGDGYATDDYAGLYYRGTELVEAVTAKQGKRGYEVKRAADGSIIETPLPTRLLE